MDVIEVKSELIDNIINAMNKENDKRVKKKETLLDIYFAVSILEQSLSNYSELMKEIDDNKNYNVYVKSDPSYSEVGTIEIYLYENESKRKYIRNYLLHFAYDFRLLGYCDCSPSDEGYDVDKCCCGVSCDWYAPLLMIEKVESVGCKETYNGIAKEYWIGETEFKEINKDKLIEIEYYKKKQRSKKIIRDIEELLKELNQLGEIV